MKNTIAKVALLTIVLAFSACNQPAGQAQTEPKPAVATATSREQSPALTPAILFGRWGDNGDCTKDIVFGADGTFRSYTGGSGTWSLNADRVTMTGASGAFEVRVSLVDQNTLMIGNADGSIGISQRC